MLGMEITDSGIEGTGGACSVKGLGLLNIHTRFGKYEKQTKQVEKLVTGNGRILGPIKGEKMKGYEIHMGETEGGVPAFTDDGSVSENGLVLGTYLHGLFENENIRNSLIGYLYNRKGLNYINRIQSDGIEELAGLVEAHLNMKMIYRMFDEASSCKMEER